MNQREISARWYKDNKEHVLKRGKAYRAGRPKEEKERHQKYYRKTKDKYIKKNLEYKKKCKDTWREVFKDLTECEVCGKPIGFASGDGNTSIHFDHRNGGDERIIGNPSVFTHNRIPSKEHIELFKSCNFGVLCGRCNRLMPTDNRKQWLKRITKYINKD